MKITKAFGGTPSRAHQITNESMMRSPTLTTTQIVSKALNADAIQEFWCGTSFLLTETVFQPVLGSLSDIFGRKPIILTSIFLFAIGVVIASLAQAIHVLLVGRAIQGLGAGGLVCLVEIIVTDLVPLRLRGKWISICTEAYALGSVSGSILGKSKSPTRL